MTMTDLILTINAGSSSIKFAAFAVETRTNSTPARRRP